MPATPPQRLAAHRPSAPLRGTARVPGDKSISHRALILGTLAVGTTVIHGLLQGEDVRRTAAALRALGARIETPEPGLTTVQGVGIGALREPADVLDLGNSGTGARLLLGLLATHELTAFLTGDASLRRRPMARVTEKLAACGARFVARHGQRLPLAVQGTGDPLPFDARMDVPSAQVKSALLLGGLAARGITRIHEPVPTRDHTERMLRHFGAVINVDETADGTRIELTGQPELAAARLHIPGDPSSAAYPLVAALLVPGSSVRIEGVGLAPLRTGLIETLREMDAPIRIENETTLGGEPVGDLVAEHAPLRAVEVPPSRAPSMIDEYPILAVACAMARGTSRLRGLAELRVKESDRLAATALLLTLNGINAEIVGDDLLIHGTGTVPGGGLVPTLLDHRLAMSALVLGCAAREPVGIDDATCIETSFPGFPALLGSLGAAIAPASAASAS